MSMKLKGKERKFINATVYNLDLPITKIKISFKGNVLILN